MGVGADVFAGHAKVAMLGGCLQCSSPVRPGEFTPALEARDVPENIDEAESRLSFDHHVEFGVPVLARESTESRRSYKLICAMR